MASSRDTAHVPLEELFDHEEAVGPAPRRGSAGRFIGRVSLITVAVAALLFTVSRALGLAPSPPLILAIAGGSALLQAVAHTAREPRWRRTRDVVRPLAGPSAAGVRPDGMITAVRRWDRALAAAGTARTARAGDDQVLVRALGELADERLRQRYGITRASDPGRARQLLGDPMWVLLRGGGAQPPTPAEAEVAVRRLETL